MVAPEPDQNRPEKPPHYLEPIGYRSDDDLASGSKGQIIDTLSRLLLSCEGVDADLTVKPLHPGTDWDLLPTDWDQALVLSRLDYCNSLLAGLPASAIKPLQRIQTAAARLVFNLPKSSHVTPLFRDLQRLPVAARITFKTTVPTYKAVNGTAPTHLRALVRPHAPARALRATTSAGRPVPPSLRASKGRTAKSQLFSVLAPLWRTDLPADVRTAESETTCFHKRLKTTCQMLFWRPSFFW
ncbi:hypothetical protein N1851_007964 [Merluccius polli]|uniref:Uncharacterized protein n=1 Tax=Merluccius polli TaxID=89951 RepID=A0AA47N3E9_MERPO|nr:hypothetical protein N1851_007964 [Merluccius polli]